MFLLFWLGLWAITEVSVAWRLIESLRQGKGASLFLLLFLGASTVGGAFGLLLVYLLLRGGKRESLELESDTLAHEPGWGAIALVRPDGSKTQWRDPPSLLGPGQETLTARSHILAVRLDRVGERQRLSIDVGADRIEIGRYLREPEREWLASVLKAWWEAR